MSQLNETKRSIEPDNLYCDILITNSSSTNTKPKAFTYNESRSLPFIKCPELYDLSVVRFTVDTGLAPVFIPSIKPNQANRDLTTYSVTLEYVGSLWNSRLFGCLKTHLLKCHLHRLKPITNMLHLIQDTITAIPIPIFATWFT